MQFTTLAASLALLFPPTALLGQEAFEDVHIDVAGTGVRVPAALAAQACGLPEGTVRQAAASRLSASGFDPDVSASLFGGNAGNETEPEETKSALPTPVLQGVGTIRTYDSDLDRLGTTTEGAAGRVTAEAAEALLESSDRPAPGGSPVTITDRVASTASTPAPGGQPVSAEGGAGLDPVLERVQLTGAEREATNAEKLAVAVCRIDQSRAEELGILLDDVGDAEEVDPESAESQ